jgi:tRNA/rRNA methyltransferase
VLQHAKVCRRLEDALEGVTLAVGLTARKRALSQRQLSLKEAVQQAGKLARDEEIAFVLGRENSGLANTELDQCQWLIRIPANPQYSSLNLAAAVQVLAYELYLAAGAAGEEEVKTPRRVKHENMETFYAQLEDTLIRVGYLNPRRPGYLMRRLRRLFSRARLEEEEWTMLMGVLKDIRKKTG